MGEGDFRAPGRNYGRRCSACPNGRIVNGRTVAVSFNLRIKIRQHLRRSKWNGCTQKPRIGTSESISRDNRNGDAQFQIESVRSQRVGNWRTFDGNGYYTDCVLLFARRLSIIPF